MSLFAQTTKRPTGPPRGRMPAVCNLSNNQRRWVTGMQSNAPANSLAMPHFFFWSAITSTSVALQKIAPNNLLRSPWRRDPVRFPRSKRPRMRAKLPFYGAVGGRLAPGRQRLYQIDTVLEKPTPTESGTAIDRPRIAGRPAISVSLACMF